MERGDQPDLPADTVRREGNEGFYGRVAWKRFGALTLADIVSTDLEVVRSRREIRAREEECFELNIQIEGHGSLRQSGRDAQTHPRSMVLCDSRKPYEMSFRGPYRQLSLRMPRELLRERLPAADALVAQRVAADGAPGRFLYDLAQGLCDPMENIPGPVAARLQDHLLDLLATAYLEAAAPLSKASGRREKLATIQSYILEHLEDPRSILRASPVRTMFQCASSMKSSRFSRRLRGVDAGAAAETRAAGASRPLAARSADQDPSPSGAALPTIRISAEGSARLSGFRRGICVSSRKSEARRGHAFLRSQSSDAGRLGRRNEAISAVAERAMEQARY